VKSVVVVEIRIELCLWIADDPTASRHLVPQLHHLCTLVLLIALDTSTSFRSLGNKRVGFDCLLDVFIIA